MIIPMYAVMLWQHTKLPGTRDQAARDPEIALALQGELGAGYLYMCFCVYVFLYVSVYLCFFVSVYLCICVCVFVFVLE